MNIKEAKKEIINTVRAYLTRDETGEYEIPPQRQRPVLLMGPPGIGKTAIMEQVARELGISLVSYTITHHTRQSAIGLPYIEKKMYGGREYSVTEYTMSEIVASVYDQIEISGIQEGILFLDEINCVSETLAPTMLQFLQYKTFGTHKVPDGYIIVTAGNPPQYNHSVRDFDIVTLDRVKRIDIEEDFSVWKEYAYRAGIHGSVMAYLDIRGEHFYSVKNDLDGRRFVTARGWEDLSRIISVYEKIDIPVTKELVVQYLQDPEIAESFATYYELYNKYKSVYRIPDILDGKIPSETGPMRDAPFDEKLSLIGLLIDSLNQEFRAYSDDLSLQKSLYDDIRSMKTQLKTGGGSIADLIDARIRGLGQALSAKKEAKLLGREEEKQIRRQMRALGELLHEEKLEGAADAKGQFLTAAGWFQKREDERLSRVKMAGDHLTHAFEFLSAVYGEGQEMVIFLSELSAGYYSLKYVDECGNDAYYRYNKSLLLGERRQQIRNEILDLFQDEDEGSGNMI